MGSARETQGPLLSTGEEQVEVWGGTIYASSRLRSWLGPKDPTSAPGGSFTPVEGEIWQDTNYPRTTKYWSASGSRWVFAPVTFGYTGGVQSFVVPSGVTSLTVTLAGAEGGAGFYSSGLDSCVGGKGGIVSGTMTVTPGETLTINVGGKPTNTAAAGFLGGYNGGGTSRANGGVDWGGGGGGATDLRQGGNGTGNRFAIAGGGGGAGNRGGPNINSAAGSWLFSADGGAGGGSTGGDGALNTTGASGTQSGKGGTQAAGGAGGGGTNVGTAGTSAGLGGIGGQNGNQIGGGGGGGYYGGGGGGNTGANPVGGGGGGSNLVPSGWTGYAGVNVGHGWVALSW